MHRSCFLSEEPFHSSSFLAGSFPLAFFLQSRFPRKIPSTDPASHLRIHPRSADLASSQRSLSTDLASSPLRSGFPSIDPSIDPASFQKPPLKVAFPQNLLAGFFPQILLPIGVLPTDFASPERVPSQILLLVKAPSPSHRLCFFSEKEPSHRFCFLSEDLPQILLSLAGFVPDSAFIRILPTDPVSLERSPSTDPAFHQDPSTDVFFFWGGTTFSDAQGSFLEALASHR